MDVTPLREAAEEETVTALGIDMAIIIITTNISTKAHVRDN